MMTDKEKGTIIRCIATCILVCEYKLIQLKDNTKQDLRFRVNNAIASCRRVQDWFIHHPQGEQETRTQIKEEMLSNEIVLLSELFETCFGISEEGLEDIIRAIKSNMAEEKNEPLNSTI